MANIAKNLFYKQNPPVFLRLCLSVWSDRLFYCVPVMGKKSLFLVISLFFAPARMGLLKRATFQTIHAQTKPAGNLKNLPA